MSFIYIRKNISIILILILGYNFLSFAEQQSTDDIDFSIKCHTYMHKDNKLKNEFQYQSMQCVAYSKKNRFRVYYDTFGISAVEKTDKDKNEIPDYIDSVCDVFDYVYEIEVVQWKMEKPRTDYEGDDKNNLYYDIVVIDCPTTPGYGPTYGTTNPIGSEYDGNKKRSYIVIDNNYSPYDTYFKDGEQKKVYNTTGIDGLKVTAAHEFHHATQFAIGVVSGKNNHSIYEMSAVCLEMLVYPDLYDYVNYVNGLTTNMDKFNFGNGYASNGYCYGIFFYMLTEKYGIDIIQNYFKLTNEVNSCYKGLDSILVLNNSNLHKEWKEFMKWLYHTGKNAIENKYFPMASRFKTPVPQNVFKNYGLNTNEIYPYQLVYTRFINSSSDPFIQPDTAELFFTNAGTNEVIIGEKENSLQTITCNAISSETNISDGEKLFDNFWLKIFSPSQNMDYLLITKAGGKVNKITHCYPTPYNKNINEHLCFPIPDDVIIGEKLKLTIYNTNQISVFSESIETSIDNHNRVLKYHPNTLNSGVYTFTISRGSTDLVGKIVIK